MIKTARIKGSRASLNAIAVAVSLRDSADVPFWLPGACDCCHKFETKLASADNHLAKMYVRPPSLQVPSTFITWKDATLS